MHNIYCYSLIKCRYLFSSSFKYTYWAGDWKLDFAEMKGDKTALLAEGVLCAVRVSSARTAAISWRIVSVS